MSDRAVYQYLQMNPKIRIWAAAAGLDEMTIARKYGGHCPFVMRAEHIGFENGRLLVVFEKME